MMSVQGDTRPPRGGSIRSNDLATALAVAALDKKGEDVVVLDMRPLVDFCDCFVLVTANNRKHAQALADEVRRVARDELHIRIGSMEGYDPGRWVLVDVGTVIVHVFDQPMRGFYHLDGLWSDAPRLPVPAPAPQA
jgi:ribosome-associated protein